MIKRIQDDRLNGVVGGNDPICACPIVCSCNNDRSMARIDEKMVTATNRYYHRA